MQKVIILIGPPGSGKDTQADFLARELGVVHVKTSALIEKKFTGDYLNDAVLKREHEIWATGKINSRDFVDPLIEDEVKKIHDQEKGIVFSGSPREAIEASIMMPMLDKFYERENINVIRINLSQEESVKRNSHRRVCKANRHPIPNFPEYEGITECPEDGSEIITRVLDDPGIIKTRYQVYLKQTEPIFDFLKEEGYIFSEVNGEQNIVDVHRDILNAIHDTEIK